MKKAKQPSHISRRDALKTIAVAATLPVVASETKALGLGQLPSSPAAAEKGPARLKFFNEHQHKTVEVLTELIIPADERSPGAKEAQVTDYIDLIVSEGTEQGQVLWKEGLAELDKLSQERFAHLFIALTPDQQTSILLDISKNEADPQTTLEKFFTEAKQQTITGYYTSKIGIHQELQYKGNIYLDEFQGCTHPEHQT